MGVIVPVGEYTAEFVFACDGINKDITWGLGFTTGNIGTPSQIAELVYDSFTVFSASLWKPYSTPVMNDNWRFMGVVVTKSTALGPLVGQHLEPTRGSSSSEVMPVNCTLLATKSTGLGGRKNRGRAYLPPLYPAESEIDQAGNITTSLLLIAQANYDRAFTALDTAGIEPVLHHSDGSAGTPISAFTIGGTIATQRRRLR